MPWIKAKNGNVFEVVDVDHAATLTHEGHEGYLSDPRVKSPKAKRWYSGDEPQADELDGETPPADEK